MMSVGKRLAKRSIIGSRVAAPGTDGKYYGGTIRAIKTPASATGDAGLSLTPETLYSVKFDEIGGKQPPISTTEYLERDLIGRGFGCINHVRLLPGQTVYFTHNSREVKAEVIQHKEHQKEVEVKILPTKDRKLPMNVMKRIGQLRLLACRKSPRLADQKTDFAKMADMNSDRKRATSDSIDVPHVPGSRKRRPSSRNSSERSWPENNNSNSASPTDMGDEHMCVREGCTNQGDHGACMDDCTAAVALLSLLHSSVSPKNVPSPNPSEPSFGTAGTSNSSSSSGSWRSTPSPVVLSAGASPTEVSAWPSSSHASGSPTSIPSCSSYGSMPGSSGSTPGSSVSIPGLSGSIPGSSGSTPGSSLMLDEGVCLPDFDMRLKEKNKRKPTKKLVANPRKPTQPTQGYIFEDCGRPNIHPMFQCSWRKCGEIRETVEQIVAHIRNVHGLPESNVEAANVQEEEFYFDAIKVIDYQVPVSSPPTLSHRDMARPPHEDPEYQKQLAMEAGSTVIKVVGTPAVRPPQTSVLKIMNNEGQLLKFQATSLPSGGNTGKHRKPTKSQHRYVSPSGSLLALSTGDKIISKSRRGRNEVKKCRKRHGMEGRLDWCTQCKWKKACTRYVV